ncbi:MAG TPA: hypothetical protein VGP93_17765 [Polyangiaceae bacterium]|nr:hypothetical protein [Polyangiaceae bacterium]
MTGSGAGGPASSAGPAGLLPVIPEQLALQPLTSALLTTAAFLDLSDDEVVPAEPARRVLERVGLYVQRLSDDEVDELGVDLERLAAHALDAGWPDEAREFIEQFLTYCGFVPEGDDDEVEGKGAEEGEDEGEDER